METRIKQKSLSKNKTRPVSRDRFDSLAAEYVGACPLPLILADRNGNVLFECDPPALYGALDVEAPLEAAMREWRRKSVEGSFSWGEAYFSTTPLGLVAFSAPVIEDGTLKGAFISGFVIFPEMAGDFDRDLSSSLEKLGLARSFRLNELGIPVISRKKIRRCADLLFRLVRKHGLSDFSVLPEQRERSSQQLHIAYYIENIKKDKQDTARVILEKQDMVMDRVARGDILGAKKIVNEFLGCIFFDSGMNFDMLKIRVMELVVILSRKAIEYGVQPRELLGLNYSSLTELNGTAGFEELCHSLTRILEKYIASLGSLKRRRKSFECRTMRGYIDQHFSERVSAEEVAAAAGLSVGRALHLLKEETGMSFTEHLRRARVEFAKYMLIDSDHSIAEIALESGFADQSHFTRQFREVENTTPRRFRADNR